MDDKNLKNFLIGMVSNVVRDIKENIFKVRVENQIKFPEEINVSNLKDVQEVTGKMTVKDLDKAIKSLEKIEKKEIKFPEQPKEIEVKNLDKLINKKEIVIPDKFAIENLDGMIELLGEIKNKKYPEYPEIKIPDNFRISNLKDIPKTENVNVDKMDSLLEAVNGIGSLNRNEKNPIPVRLSDGKYFYKALSEVIERAISVGGVNNVGLRNTDNERINPATEGTLSTIKDKIVQMLFHHGHLKVLGYWESVGHNTTNTTITKERASGRKTGIGTGAFSIIETYPFVQPGGDTQMYVQSTSPQDGVAGTGVQEITIEYFEYAWGDMKTETVVMNGTTQVTFSFSNVYRIHSIKATKIGTSQNAEGNITITDLATTTLYGQIDQYNNYMERCIFYVANGKQVTCTEISIGSVTSGGVEIRLVASEEDSAGNIVPRARVPFEIVSGGQYIKFKIDETVINPNNNRIALLLVVRATSTASNQKATGAMKGVTESITES